MPLQLHKISFPGFSIPFKRTAASACQLPFNRRPAARQGFFRNSFTNFSLLLTVMVSSFFSSCQMFWAPHSPKGYVMPRPEIHFLDKKLSEISGLFYLKGEGSMLAIADDKKHIYRLYTDGREADYFEESFGESADYEDVVKVDSSIFVLASNGTILETIRTDSGLLSREYSLRVPLPEEKEEKKGKKDNKGKSTVDFETIYYDPSARGLILLSKSIKGESKQGIRSAWRFDLATRSFDPEPFYKFKLSDINEALKDGRVEFKPSAAAISPVTGELYVLSSAGHMLVVADLRGKVHHAFRLNPSFYPQAEGIAFAENGDMYISNEAKLGKPSLLRIPYAGQKGSR
jgi:uncharacterized protein YjiK